MQHVSSHSPEEFRTAVREWFAANVDLTEQRSDPAGQRGGSDEYRRRITAAAYDAGLLHVTWPVAYGGGGLPSEYQTILNEESVLFPLGADQ